MAVLVVVGTSLTTMLEQHSTQHLRWDTTPCPQNGSCGPDTCKAAHTSPYHAVTDTKKQSAVSELLEAALSAVGQ